MRTKYSNDIIDNLAEKYGLTKGEVTKIVESPLKLLRRIMSEEVIREEGIFPNIRIPKFGMFHVPEFRREKLKKKGVIKI